MRSLLTALCLAAALCASTPAFALQSDHRAFPPDNCSSASPFMGFTGVDGSNTFCNSGQDIFTNALPNCTPGQYVNFDGKNFTCETVPTCLENRFLQFDGRKFICTPLPYPVCGDGQTMTLVNGRLVCTGPDNKCVPNNTVTGTDACSATCGGGTQTVHWSDGCGNSSTTVQPCNTQTCTCTPHNTITGYGACVSAQSWCNDPITPPHFPCTGVQDVYWSDGCGNSSTTQQACTR